MSMMSTGMAAMVEADRKGPRVLKYVGLESTLFILCAMFAFLCVFGAILQAVEADEEIRLNEQFAALMDNIKNNITDEAIAEILAFANRDPVKGTEGFVTYNAETQTWERSTLAFFSSVSYCFNLISTIGYGDIIVRTDLGKVVSVLCILTGFPIAVAAYTRFSDFAFSIFSIPYNRYLWRNNRMVKIVLEQFDRNHNGKLDVQELSKFFERVGADVSDEEVERVIRNIEGPDMYDGEISVQDFLKICEDPVLSGQVGLLGRETYKLQFSFVLLIGFVVIHMLVAQFVFELNAHGIDPFYFTIVTITTVGLGDIVPTVEWRTLAAAMAFAGVGFMLMFLMELVARLQSRTDFQKRSVKRAIRDLATRRSGAQAAVEPEA